MFTGFRHGFAKGAHAFSHGFRPNATRLMSTMLVRDTALMCQNNAMVLVALNHRLELLNVMGASLLETDDDEVAASLDDDIENTL